METNLFQYYFNNAVINSILIMDVKGTILEVNNAFTANFGYTTDDLKGRNFKELFTSTDRKQNKPELELKTAVKTGQSNDEGYILNKAGTPVWCSGEVMLALDSNGKKLFIKDVINLQSKKYLNLFLKNTEELLDRIFHASSDIPMVILDGSLKIQDMNKAFINFFGIENNHKKNESLWKLNNPFWNKAELKSDFTHMLVTNVPLVAKPYQYLNNSGKENILLIDTKIIYYQPDKGRRIFVIVDEQASEYEVSI